MLLANRTVAESVACPGKGKKPKTLPYRIHDDPDPQKLENLRELTAKLGYKMKSTSTKGATARALNKLMEEVDGHREAKLVQTIALRSMMKAKYSPTTSATSDWPSTTTPTSRRPYAAIPTPWCTDSSPAIRTEDGVRRRSSAQLPRGHIIHLSMKAMTRAVAPLCSCFFILYPRISPSASRRLSSADPDRHGYDEAASSFLPRQTSRALYRHGPAGRQTPQSVVGVLRPKATANEFQLNRQNGAPQCRVDAAMCEALCASTSPARRA